MPVRSAAVPPCGGAAIGAVAGGIAAGVVEPAVVGVVLVAVVGVVLVGVVVVGVVVVGVVAACGAGVVVVLELVPPAGAAALGANTIMSTPFFR
jgi:hypothetical protein